MFTSSFELVTGITNVIICIVSIILFSRKKLKDKLWNLFYICLIIDSFLGSIIHGILMSDGTKNLLWIILSCMFCITINILLTIFLKKVKSKIKDSLYIVLSCIIYLVIIVEFILSIDFLNTFIVYACMCLLIILVISIKLYIKDKNNVYFILGILFQIIGGLFLIFPTKISMLYLDKNGIYHLFMILTEVMFYKGALK